MERKSDAFREGFLFEKTVGMEEEKDGGEGQSVEKGGAQNRHSTL